MAAHDVMEVTTMPMEPSLGPETLDDVDVDAVFADIVLADVDLVDLEFEALVSAEFGEPPESGAVPHDDPGDERPRPGPRDALTPRSRSAARLTAARRRNRQRSPPSG
ncbi:hypothetical protein [Terrabacter terrigena]|uniref:Uncharacterized protein n=1 Tax=Terrabacter terrigena TaxID=574718 RepID=A0ABW3N0H7_9MICO